MTDRTEDSTPTVGRPDVSRRRLLGLAAAAAAGAAARPVEWVFALEPGGAIVKRQAPENESYRPVLFSSDELEGLARVCDVIIPRTGTPGARDARVHEYIDLATSVDDEEDREAFQRGLERLDRSCRDRHSVPLHEASADQITALLTPLSEEAAKTTDEDQLSDEAGFFNWVKSRTIYGYYTSREGRVELGLPETVSMETWHGCRHEGGAHDEPA